MTKTPIAAALTACCALANAQSSLTIYGRADVGTVVQTNRAVSHGGTFKFVQNTVWNASQIGFKGQEDLGNQWRTVFDLGSTVVFDTGANASANKFWDRNAYVGIGHPTFGSLLLGRQINTLADTFYVVDPLGTCGPATNMNVRFGYFVGPGATITNHFGPTPGVAGANLDRVDNTVKYTVKNQPTGLSAIAMIAPGEGNGGRAGGGLLGWDYGAFSVRGSAMQYKDNTGVPLKAYATGVAWKGDTLQFRASYASNKIDSPLATTDQPYRNQKTDIASAGVKWIATPFLELSFAYYRGKRTLDGAPEQVAQKFYFVPEYRLSKRTSVVMVAVRERFNETGALLDTGTPLVAGTRGSTYVGTAISHAF